jgi:sporulation protein YlmC with PRC-barrel domain
MRGTRSLGLALIAAALGAAPALAQQNGAAPPANAPAQMAPAPGAGMTPNALTPPSAPMVNTQSTAARTTGPSGSLEKYNGEWRTSKLVGATVFDSNGDSLGTINDLLTDDSGKISQAVISTGGVLGMGGKLVEVPFDQLKLEPSAGNNGPALAAGTPNTPVGSNPPAAGNASTTVAANEAPAHPTYYSIVLPNATKDSLSKQQTFKFASTD